MSHINDIALLDEVYDDDAVQRIAATRGHKADHFVHPGWDARAWPILAGKTEPTSGQAKGGARILRAVGSGAGSVARYNLHEPEKSSPGEKPGWGGGGFAPLHSLEIGKNKRVTVHQHAGHSFYLYRDENPRTNVGNKYIPSSGGGEHSMRLYGSKEGFAAAGIANPTKLRPPSRKQEPVASVGWHKL
jgi:hypothetical protein